MDLTLRDRSRGRRAWGIAVDLIIATALIWSIPLLLGAARAFVRFLQQAM